MEQHFENLDALLLSCRQILNAGPRIHLQSIVCNQFIETALHFSETE